MLDKVKVELTINNKTFNIETGIVFFKMTMDILSLGRRATLELSPPDTSRLNGFRFKAGDGVRIFFNNDLVFTGYIMVNQHKFENQRRQIILTLIDKVGYMQTANPVAGGKKYTQRNLIALFTQILKDNGCNNISVEQDLFDGNITKSLSALIQNNFVLKDDAVIEKGDTLGDFFDRYANKAQILFTSNDKGNLLLTTENKQSTNYGISIKSNISGTSFNNIISRTYTDTIQDRFSQVQIYGVQSIFNVNTKNASNILAQATDATSPIPRTKIINYQDPIDQTTARQLARFIVNANKAKSIMYECTIVGWRWHDGSLIKPNTRISINDGDLELQGEFQIKDVTYNYNIENISADLTIVDKNVLTPDISRSENFLNFGQDIF